VAITAGVPGELRSTDPARVGPYRVLGRLGEGGMGHVYLARSPGGRAVAIKVIRPELAGKRGFRARFAREVAAARGVSGMFTAAVVDADPDAVLPWMATAYVEGPSLADAVEEHGPLAPGAVLSLAAGLAEGLQAIHDAGLVHRDLKPSNVLLAKDGPRVIDFGIAWAREEEGTGDRLTDAGMVVGSPGFISPEQAMGRAVLPASDVFSLGAVLAYAASGTEPFGYGVTQALMYRVVHEPPDLSLVPARLRRLVGSCLAKEPGHRPTMIQLLDQLARFPADPDAAADRDEVADLLAAASWTPARSQPGRPASEPSGSGLRLRERPGEAGLHAASGAMMPRTGDRLPGQEPRPAGSLAGGPAGPGGAARGSGPGGPGGTRARADGDTGDYGPGDYGPGDGPSDYGGGDHADQPRWRRWGPAVAAVAILGLLAGVGVLLIATTLSTPPAAPAVPGVRMPSIPAVQSAAPGRPGSPPASSGLETMAPPATTASPSAAAPTATPATTPSRPARSAPPTAPASARPTGPAASSPPAPPPPATPPPSASVSPAPSSPGCFLICL
jgi:serine/threonine protein kinase